MGDAKSNEFEFHMQEYNSLRQEIFLQQNRRHEVNRFGFSGIIIVYAWCFSDLSGGRTDLIIFAPTLISIACLIMQNATSKGIKACGAYLAILERKYADPELLGWENLRSVIRLNSNASNGNNDSYISESYNKIDGILIDRINIDKGPSVVTEKAWGISAISTFIFACHIMKT